jgi:protein-S-isoprenylcysteine O-methyltransferase Ste14
MALANCGFVLFTVNPAAVCALIWLITVLVWRIRTEERTMWAVPGYAAYAAGRPRLLPGVW